MRLMETGPLSPARNLSNGVKAVGLAGLLAVLVVGLRVLTYNIHHGEGTDGEFDLQRLAGVIESANPDLVALQEVDVETERSDHVDQANRLAEITGMEVVFGRTQDYQGGEFGNAILTRLPVLDVRNKALPSTESTDEKTHYPRGAVAIETRSANGIRLRFISTHFQHNLEADRIAQARKINALFAAEDDNLPAILAGDLNATPGSRPMQILTQRWTDAAAENPRPTVPVDQPDRRIDYVLYRPANRWRVLQSRVLGETIASDHRPVLAELQPLPDPQASEEQRAAEREIYREIRDRQRQLRRQQP